MAAALIALPISVPLFLITAWMWSLFSFQTHLQEHDSLGYFAVMQNYILNIAVIPQYLKLPYLYLTYNISHVMDKLERSPK